MAYCVELDVTSLIPTGYGSADLASADGSTAVGLATMITRADEIIDAKLRPYCYKFNATGATPATPSIIRMASAHIAVAQAVRQTALRQGGQGLIEIAAAFHDTAMEALDSIIAADGETDLETTTAEALTFGTNDTPWGLSTTEARVAATTPLDSGDPPAIVYETARLAISAAITGYTAAQLNQMRRGIEWDLVWDWNRRMWIFRALNSTLLSAAVKLTYGWNYRRIGSEGSGLTNRMVAG